MSDSLVYDIGFYVVLKPWLVTLLSCFIIVGLNPETVLLLKALEVPSNIFNLSFKILISFVLD
jgi:hypothetical protein